MPNAKYQTQISQMVVRMTDTPEEKPKLAQRATDGDYLQPLRPLVAWARMYTESDEVALAIVGMTLRVIAEEIAEDKDGGDILSGLRNAANVLLMRRELAEEPEGPKG